MRTHSVFLLACLVLAPAALIAQNASHIDSQETTPGEPTTKIAKVVLIVVVDRDGYPREVKVSKSASKELDKTAVDAVKKWKFDPAKKNGEPVAVKVSVEVNFTCDENNKCDLTPPKTN